MSISPTPDTQLASAPASALAPAPAPSPPVPPISTHPTNPTPPSPTPTPSPSPLASDLHSMFPTLSISIIQMIVESHSPPAPGGYGGDGGELTEGEVLDRCIGDLLVISDPEFKPEPTPSTDANQAAHISLDEQFARSLALQDQQRLHQSQTTQTQTSGGLPYQPRIRKTPVARYESRSESYNSDGEEYHGDRQELGPGVGEQIEERFEKFAEVGKKTFDSLFNKAKSKYNEFQESQAQRQAQQSHSSQFQSQPPTQGQTYQTGPRGGATTATTTTTTAQGGIATTLGGLWSGAQELVKEATAGIQGGQGGKSHQTYAQTEREGSWNQQKAGHSGSTAQKVETKRWSPNDVYDDETSQRADVYAPPSSTNSSFSIPSPPRPSTALPMTTASTSVGRSKGLDVPGGGEGTRGSTTTGGNNGTSGTSPGSGKIDTSKLGMLPKKKVTLLSSNQGTSVGSGSGTGAGTSSASTLAAIPSPSTNRGVKTSGKEDDDIEEEFTQSPFDE